VTILTDNGKNLKVQENLPDFLENIFIVLRFQKMYIFRINKADQKHYRKGKIQSRLYNRGKRWRTRKNCATRIAPREYAVLFASLKRTN